MRIAVLTLAALAALSVAACQQQEAAPGDDAPDAAATPTEEELVATQSSEVLLAADGLRLQAEPAGPVETVALGASREDALAAVTRALGAEPRETGAFEECGAGATDYAAWDRGLTLLFTGDELTGWESTADDLNTPEDIHVGSSVEDLRAVYPDVEIQETTVGWAFIVGDLYGHLDDSQTRVERIRLGANCDAH